MASLSRLGCSLMQGYLFSKPIRREDFEAAVTAPDAQWKQPVASREGWEPPE